MDFKRIDSASGSATEIPKKSLNPDVKFDIKNEPMENSSMADDAIQARCGATKSGQSEIPIDFGKPSFLKHGTDDEGKNYGKTILKNHDKNTKGHEGHETSSSKATLSRVKSKDKWMSDKQMRASESQVQADRVREIRRQMAEREREGLRRRKQSRRFVKKSNTPSPVSPEIQAAGERARFIQYVEGAAEQLRDINLRLDKRITTLG